MISTHSLASDWVLLRDDPDFKVEWDRANIHERDGGKVVRQRISWKREQIMDNGIRFKFSMNLMFYSCIEKTESLMAVSNFSADRKLVYKANVGPIIQRSQSYKGFKDYNDVDRMLKNVC